MADQDQKDPNADRRAYLKTMFPDMDDDKLNDLINKSSNPQKFTQPANVQSPAMSPMGQPQAQVPMNPYANTAQVLTGRAPTGMSEGGMVDKLQALKKLRDFRQK